MRTTRHAKGVADIRTAISARSRSASRHKGTPYLEIAALGLEKLRLEMEIERLSKQEMRVRNRLAETRTRIESNVAHVQKDGTPGPETPRDGDKPRARGPWRVMAVEY